MTEDEKQKYIGKVELSNYAIGFLAIDKESRRIVELFLTGQGAMDPDITKAALFADCFAAATFLRSAPFDIVKSVPKEFEIIPHSTFYKEATVTYLYLPKDDKGEYHVDFKVMFHGDQDLEGVFDANGLTSLRRFVNNQFPVDTGDVTHV